MMDKLFCYAALSHSCFFILTSKSFRVFHVFRVRKSSLFASYLSVRILYATRNYQLPVQTNRYSALNFAKDFAGDVGQAEVASGVAVR